MGRGSRNQDTQQNQDYNAAQRAAQVIALRLQGLEFDAIAAQTGYKDRSGPWRVWKKYLAALPQTETEQLRKESEQRLNVALAAIWEKVKKGDSWAIDRMLAIEKRRAELLGLDKQKEVANRPADEVRREYVGVDLANLFNGHHQAVSAAGGSVETLSN